ncbi:MAG TPA: hypothetical protein VFG29_06490 [Syntrophales bacterium]|nr:hypothetical protein [Syntrophales bacterium]
MVESVKVLPKEIQDVIEVYTWDVKKLEGIKKKMELRARTVPSIAVNGEVLFQCVIPQQDELLAAILERLPR